MRNSISRKIFQRTLVGALLAASGTVRGMAVGTDWWVSGVGARGSALAGLEQRAMAGGRPRWGLAGAREAAAARGPAQGDQRFGVAHGAGHAVDHRHGQLTVQRTGQAGERRARQDDHFGAVLGRRRARPAPCSACACPSCTPPMAASGRSSARMLASRRAEAVASTTSRYQAWMRCEMAMMEMRWPEQVRAGERRLGQPGHGHRQQLAQAGQARVAEGGDHEASKCAQCSAASCAVA